MFFCALVAAMLLAFVVFHFNCSPAFAVMLDAATICPGPDLHPATSSQIS
jgi:hypothetical protein